MNCCVALVIFYSSWPKWPVGIQPQVPKKRFLLYSIFFHLLKVWYPFSMVNNLFPKSCLVMQMILECGRRSCLFVTVFYSLAVTWSSDHPHCDLPNWYCKTTLENNFFALSPWELYRESFNNTSFAIFSVLLWNIIVMRDIMGLVSTQGSQQVWEKSE